MGPVSVIIKALAAFPVRNIIVLNLKPLKRSTEINGSFLVLIGSVFLNCLEGLGRGEVLVICLGGGGFDFSLSLTSSPRHVNTSMFFCFFSFLLGSEKIRNCSVSALSMLCLSVFRNPPMALTSTRRGRSGRRGSATPSTTSSTEGAGASSPCLPWVELRNCSSS